MLNFEPTKPLAPLSMKLLLDQGAKLPSSEITRIALFMQLGCQPRQPPPYLHVWFNETGRLLVDMISCILEFNTSEFVDETILVLLSMFAPGPPPVVQYDYATFIADKIHEQFTNLRRNRAAIQTESL